MAKSKYKKNKNIEIKDNIPSFLKSNYFIYLILFLIVSLAFYIRGVIPHDSTFRNGIVGIAMDDAVYHMRLVENLIANFPHRLTYDAFTQFPYGQTISWGIFFDLIIGTLAIIFGVNNLNIVGAYVPAIMGALTIIPVYFIGAELLNKKSGLISAFLVAILPGAFLQRSTLGFTDHHVAEVLFTTTFIMYLIFAVNRVREMKTELYWNGLTKNPLTYIFKTSLKYAILSGIFLGFYLLTWTTGLLFVGIFVIFIIIQIIINYIQNKSNSSLLIITTIICGISSIMVLPFVDLNNGFSVVYYSLTHIIFLLSVILITLYMNWLSIKMKKEKRDIFQFLIVITISFGGFLFLMGAIFPSFYANTIGSLGVLFNAKSGGGLTIGEAAPTNLGVIYSMFGYNFIFALLSGILLVIYYIKEKKEKILIVLVWSTLMLILLFAQNRWAYYFAINIAIFSGFICGYFLDYFGGWKNIKSISVWNISSLTIVILIIGFLPLNSSPFEISTKTTQYGVMGDGFYEWRESLIWMRNNTPDPGIDYYGTYMRPQNGEKYPYPDSAYGVMSWWDYGHIITYWAHRIPSANPFQSGIGGGVNNPGAAPFLVAQTEDDANRVLDRIGINNKSGARYIVSNAYMAYAIQPIFAEWDGTNIGYYQQMQTSQGYQTIPTEKYYSTMESRLHILDGNSLKYYRLIHESNPNPNTAGGNNELVYKQIYNALINKNNPIKAEYSGFAKIFECVPGATITGTISPNTTITIKNTIRTNIGREFQYKQINISNERGEYLFVVPYSTFGTISNGTIFDTKTEGSYILSYGNISKNVDISEEQIMNGTIVNI